MEMTKKEMVAIAILLIGAIAIYGWVQLTTGPGPTSKGFVISVDGASLNGSSYSMDVAYWVPPGGSPPDDIVIDVYSQNRSLLEQVRFSDPSETGIRGITLEERPYYFTVDPEEYPEEYGFTGVTFQDGKYVQYAVPNDSPFPKTEEPSG